MITPDGLRQVFKYLIVDCHDRKITREAFEEIVELVLETEHAFTRMMALVLINKVFEKYELDTPTINEQINVMAKDVVDARKVMVSKFSLVMECRQDPMEIC